MTAAPEPDSLEAREIVLSNGIRISIGAGLVAALLVWYGAGEIRDGSFVYYQSLQEFSSEGKPGESARVHGYVAKGSIRRLVSDKQVLFQVQNDPVQPDIAAGEVLDVLYASLETPDLFKDGAEVVVEGVLNREGIFIARNVLAKCPSKFEGVGENENNSLTKAL